MSETLKEILSLKIEKTDMTDVCEAFIKLRNAKNETHFGGDESKVRECAVKLAAVVIAYVDKI